MATENKKIKDPYYADKSSNLIVCDFVYEDGTSATVSIGNTPEGEKDNPDWKQVFREFTHEEIKANTKVKEDAHHANQASRAAQEKADIDKAKNEALFAAKVDSFEIPEIKASKNRALKSKVRKATNMIEIMAYSAAIIIEENAKAAEA
jgi:Pyruvate/2-oxoacid:ferredoxin oxidoreductase gamma subunit